MCNEVVNVHQHQRIAIQRGSGSVYATGSKWVSMFERSIEFELAFRGVRETLQSVCDYATEQHRSEIAEFIDRVEQELRKDESA